MQGQPNLLWFQLGAGAVVFIAGYGIWQLSKVPVEQISKSSRPLISGKRPRGIPNLGNTCFINSVLQCISSLDSIYEYLINNCQDESNPWYMDESKSVAMKLTALLQTLRDYTSSSAADPYPFFKSLNSGSSYKSLLCYRQQDAHEFLQLLCSTLASGSQIRKSLVFSTITAESTNSFVKSRIFTCIDKMIMLPTTGMLAYRIQCNDCFYSGSISHQSFNIITISLPFSNCDLPTCLKQFVEQEAIHGWNCPKCSLKNTLKVLRKLEDLLKSFGSNSKSLKHLEQDSETIEYNIMHCVDATLPESIKLHTISPKLNAIRQCRIAHAPECLVIHLQRSAISPYGHVYKNNVRVEISQYLNIDPYTVFPTFQRGKMTNQYFPVEARSVNSGYWKQDSALKGSTPIGKNYQLTAVTLHNGSHDSGHFSAFRMIKDIKGYEWYLISDTSVQQVDLNQVLQHSSMYGYMLYYERIPIIELEPAD